MPGFFVSFLESRKKKGNYIVGNFILGKFYSINRLKELPIFCHLITYKEKKMTSSHLFFIGEGYLADRELSLFIFVIIEL